MKPSDLIERYGWVQGQLGNTRIGFCLEGAIFEWEKTQWDKESYESAYQSVYLALGSQNLVIWNDAPSRTKAEVLAVLRQVGR